MEPITEETLKKLGGPNQILGEWKTYLRFLCGYCEEHGISNPTVVEIGTQNGRQKAHYVKFLDAVHIGIDVSNEWSKPDIVGNSHDPTTVGKLKNILGGKPINFLFIDGGHTYADAMADYLIYGPLVSDAIAFHDIRHEKEIAKLWQDLQVAEKDNQGLTFLSVGAWGNGWCELGIGIIVKKNKDSLKGREKWLT